MTDNEWWAYIAGFADGEGCFMIPLGRNTSSPQVKIAQTGYQGLRVLSEMSDFLVAQGLEGVRLAKYEIAYRGRKLMYNLLITNRKSVLTFFEKTLPYLHVKRHTAQDIIRYTKLFPSLDKTWRDKSGLVCSKGHILSDENIGMEGRSRRCLACRRRYQREWWHRRAKA